MTNTKIKDRINTLDREIWLIEMADYMSDEEQEMYDKLSRERNALVIKLYYMEHPQKTKKEIEEESRRDYERWVKEEKEREKEIAKRLEETKKARSEYEKKRSLEIWETIKNSNLAYVEILRTNLIAKGWI